MALKFSQQSIHAARMILEHPIVMEIFNHMESQALDGAVNAKITDIETPAAFLAEVRAIRKFRSDLEFIILNGEANLKRDQASK